MSSSGGQQRESAKNSEATRHAASPSDAIWEGDTDPIEINFRNFVHSVAFLNDNDTSQVLSGGEDVKIRRWRVQDGSEAGRPMVLEEDASVWDVAVSRDGAWVVVGMRSGLVTVCNAKNGGVASEFKAHDDEVNAVDFSEDGTRIATGSRDGSACIWDFSGRPVLGPLEHENWVVAVRFSPDGRLLATATFLRESVRVYDSQDGRLVASAQIRVNSSVNRSLAWADDSRRLFALSHNGCIFCLDTSNGSTLSQWYVHKVNDPRCIALAGNGKFIVASADSTISFWDTETHLQIGSVIDHSHTIWSMAISTNYNIAIAGNREMTLRDLCDILPSPYRDDILHQRGLQATKDGIDIPEDQKAGTIPERTTSDVRHSTTLKKICLEDTITSLRRDIHAREEREVQLKKTIQHLRSQLAMFNKDKDILNQTIASLRAELHARDESAISRISCLEETIHTLSTQHAGCHQNANKLSRIIRAHEQKHQCENLYTRDRIYDTTEMLLEIRNNLREEAITDAFLDNWLTEFTNQCITMLERIGDEALNDKKSNDALKAYSTALSLAPSNSTVVLTKWTRTMLIGGSADTVLNAAAQFTLSDYGVYRAICNVLEEDGRVNEAVECFKQMQSNLRGDDDVQDKRIQWESDFRRRCAEKLERRGDSATGSGHHGEAIGYYSSALSLDPSDMNAILIKCCKARASLLEEALMQADKEITRDESSYKGYMKKYAALHGMRRHKEAFGAFEVMLSKIKESPDPSVLKLRHRYVDATPKIRRIVQHTIRNIPRVLINTHTGRHFDKQLQAAAFEQLPVFNELRSSMTTHVDEARIRREVKKYYRYVMFSHRWEDGEPLFQKVEGISVYDLEPSSPNIKLQTFCKIVRGLGFEWVWSDTCCIDKKDNVILQESLVAMFTWYRGSSLTLVYLRGVWSHSAKPGALRGSIWNTRAWTYQEYVAAETVQFYTEDWKPYLGLTMYNHKDSPTVVSEMQQIAEDVTQDLAVLRPNLERVREKLYVASMRQTTVVEDIAYSLLGIFNAAIPVIYGEGDRAVGRLLEHVLTGSGDVTILAWTGHSGSYNSCLPVDLTVYSELVPPHIPDPIQTIEIDQTVMALHSSVPDISLALKLYGRLDELPSPTLAASRLRVYCISFPISGFILVSGSDSDSDLHVYRAMTVALGDVEIKTTDDLSETEKFILIHPWISPLLDQDFARHSDGVDDATRALRLVARLRQPFGALLLSSLSRVRYRRVATDCLIMVRIREEASLAELVDGIRPVDIQ